MKQISLISKSHFRIILIVLCFFIFPGVSAAAPKPKAKPLSEEDKLVKAIENVKQSVVSIRAVGTSSSGSPFRETGSGVVLKENGFILTNYHVIKTANDITVTIFNGKKYHAVVAGKSPKDDLAVLKINSNGLRKPKWGDSKKLKIGMTAIAIGNPYKFDWSVSRGIISGLNRQMAAAGIIYREMIQTDAAINPGSSGGALIDSAGEVIGINTIVHTGSSNHAAQGLGFAIPIHRALKVSQMLVSNKVVYNPKPWVGIGGMNVTPDMAETSMLPVRMGVLITSIQPVSPAERGGLRRGDIVVMGNDKIIRSVSDFKQIIADCKPGQTLTLSVWRGDKNMSISLKVSQRSSAAEQDND
jgi:S1-C subfamily serine protease